MSLRAEILDTGNPQIRGASIIINASAKSIFEVLADPTKHSVIDGSNSVKSVLNAPKRLSLGARFGMNMKIGIKYRITNTVVEFEEGGRIAWQHLGKWIWRYELKPITSTQTLVTETFDATSSPLKLWLKMRGAYPSAEIAIAKTLVRLKKYLEGEKL